MKIKTLKKYIKNMPDDREVLLVGYNEKTGGTIFKSCEPCCNTEHQERNNEFWISLEGINLYERSYKTKGI